MTSSKKRKQREEKKEKDNFSFPNTGSVGPEQEHPFDFDEGRFSHQDAARSKRLPGEIMLKMAFAQSKGFIRFGSA